MLELPRAMRTRLLWCITLVLLCHLRLSAQTVTTEFPPIQPTPIRSADLPDDPSLPVARVVPQPEQGVPVKLVANTQARKSLEHGNLYTLDGDVVIYYRDYVVHADHASYNDSTGEVEASGHLMIDGGPDDEHFVASDGSLNVNEHTGRFYDVVGTLGVSRTARGRMVFTAPNPFAITARRVEQLGPGHYKVIHGTMTSCLLPKPDWRILAENIELNNGIASSSGDIFELFRVPLVYLPYVSHPIADQRNSGILLPYFGKSTTKGFVFGEGYYQTLGRSADLTMATQFWSKRGWAPNGTFRYRGPGLDFGIVRFHSLLDRGFPLPNGTKLNQGGVDVVADTRYDFSPKTTGVVDAEYLSSYVYRLVFEEEYALAINSEVKSQAFITHQDHDTWTSMRMNRYQNFQNANVPGDEVRILHLPQIDVETAEHSLYDSPLRWEFSASAATLSRFEYPSFRTTASVPRVDFYPRVSVPLHWAGWNFKPRAGVRETWYGKSQAPADLEQIPIVRKEGLARTAIEGGFELRPPALERDFSPSWLERLLGGDVRHTIEPEFAYRYVTGVNNFRTILRFDDVDVVSNTNEAEYGLTQRLYLRHLHPHPCKGDEALGPSDTCGGGTVDWITWRVAQKYYFDPSFDNAITRGTPNPLQTTLDFTGVDFLTQPRHTTPVISRLQMRTSGSTDVEWDLDYDVKLGKIASSNVFTGYRKGLYRFTVGDFYVNVPLGTTPLSTEKSPPGNPSAPNPFNQVHASAVHGAANKLGFSEGAATAYDFVHQKLQYGAIQAQYNWNCCGIDFQYRRFSLGGIRDDTEYFWSFNLAGFTNIGDLTHRISLF